MIRTETVPRPDGEVTRVTFELPGSIWAESVHVVGDFNGWDPGASPMRRGPDEAWRLAVELERPGSYRFAYLVDGSQWRTDASVEWSPGGPGGDCMVLRALHRRPVPAPSPRLRPARRSAAPIPTAA